MSTFYYAFPFAALLGAAAVALASDPPKLRWLAAALRLSRGRHAVRGPVRRRLDAAYRASAAWLSKYAGRGPAATDGIEIVEPESEAGEGDAPDADEEPSPFDPLTASDIRRLVLADTALFAGTPPAAPEWATHSDMTGYLPKFDARVLAEMDAQREMAGAA